MLKFIPGKLYRIKAKQMWFYRTFPPRTSEQVVITENETVLYLGANMDRYPNQNDHNFLWRDKIVYIHYFHPRDDNKFSIYLEQIDLKQTNEEVEQERTQEEMYILL